MLKNSTQDLTVLGILLGTGCFIRQLPLLYKLRLTNFSYHENIGYIGRGGTTDYLKSISLDY